jgi:hypothetical protein
MKPPGSTSSSPTMSRKPHIVNEIGGSAASVSQCSTTAPPVREPALRAVVMKPPGSISSSIITNAGEWRVHADGPMPPPLIPALRELVGILATLDTQRSVSAVVSVD